ncbi:MAG: peptidoglycan recognition protein family protein [Candidatus Thorarchaeota archaeon]|jgi:hypothetical protein
MRYDLESSPRKKRAFNNKTEAIYSWSATIPWRKLGIDPSDGVQHEEILTLQEAVGVNPDGLMGRDTLRALQLFLQEEYCDAWNPVTGELSTYSPLTQHLIWNGLKVPMQDVECAIVPFTREDGIDLHSVGSFTKVNRDINSVVVHWGGLNPHHLGRVFANRKASSHLAIGRAEKVGNTFDVRDCVVFQYLDLGLVAWHAKGANRRSIGIDICQQPELKHLGYYRKHKYDVETIENPAHPYGPRKVISLDPEIKEATSQILSNLKSAFHLPPSVPSSATGCVSKEEFEAGGIYSHFHVDFAGQGKWDVAPWWDSITESL